MSGDQTLTTAFERALRASTPPGWLDVVLENCDGEVGAAEFIAEQLNGWREQYKKAMKAKASLRDLTAERHELWTATAARLRKDRPVSLAPASACARAVCADLKARVARGEVAAEMLGAERTIRRAISER